VYDARHNGDGRAMPPSDAQASAAFNRGGTEGEFALSLRDVTQVVLRRLWIVLLVMLIFVGATVAASLWQTPQYEASAKVFVGQKPATGEGNLAGNVEGLQSLTQTMIIAIDSRPVASEAIQRLGLRMEPDALLGNLDIEQVESSTFIQLTYTDTDPQRAQRVVNTVGEVSSERIAQISAAASPITAAVWEAAIVPNTPVRPDPVRNGVLAAGLGLMLGIGLVFLMEYLDDTWRSPEEVERVSGVPTFATVPEFDLAKNGKKKGR
jgi:capsular polysaccharide biosynthesis protein